MKALQVNPFPQVKNDKKWILKYLNEQKSFILFLFAILELKSNRL